MINTWLLILGGEDQVNSERVNSQQWCDQWSTVNSERVNGQTVRQSTINSQQSEGRWSTVRWSTINSQQSEGQVNSEAIDDQQFHFQWGVRGISVPLSHSVRSTGWPLVIIEKKKLDIFTCYFCITNYEAMMPISTTRSFNFLHFTQLVTSVNMECSFAYRLLSQILPICCWRTALFIFQIQVLHRIFLLNSSYRSKLKAKTIMIHTNRRTMCVNIHVT